MTKLIIKYGILMAIGLLSLNFLPIVPKLNRLSDPSFQGLFQLILIASFLMYGINSYVREIQGKYQFSYLTTIGVGVAISTIAALLFTVISLTILFIVTCQTYQGNPTDRFISILSRGSIISLIITFTYSKRTQLNESNTTDNII